MLFVPRQIHSKHLCLLGFLELIAVEALNKVFAVQVRREL